MGHIIGPVLKNLGFNITVLTRNPKTSCDFADDYLVWDLTQGPFKVDPERHWDWVINLAGQTIARVPWTKGYKRKLFESRVTLTLNLFESFGSGRIRPPGVYIGMSAVGIYPKNSRQVFTEDSRIEPPDGDFLAELCLCWEKAHKNFAAISPQWAIWRLGIVLASKGGFVNPLKSLPFFPIDLTQKLVQPWVDELWLQDVLTFFVHHSWPNGVYNLCYPQTLSWNALMARLAQVWPKPLLPFPLSWGRYLPLEPFNYFASSQLVKPHRLEKNGMLPPSSLDRWISFCQKQLRS